MEVIILWILAILGLMSHYVKHMIQAKRSGSKITLLGYWTENKWETIGAILGMLAGMLVMHGDPDLTKAVAFGIGFMSNSVADILGNRSKSVANVV